MRPVEIYGWSRYSFPNGYSKCLQLVVKTQVLNCLTLSIFDGIIKMPITYIGGANNGSSTTRHLVFGYTGI